jgi:hypothetical protein
LRFFLQLHKIVPEVIILIELRESVPVSELQKPAIDVVPFEHSLADTWHAFVESSNNGTEFHRTDFLEYHPEDRYDFRHLLFFRKGCLVSVLPGAVTGETFRSPAGASIGGFVHAPCAGLETADAVVHAFVSWCRGAGITEAFIGLPMPVYERTLDDSMEFALLYNGFSQYDAKYSSVADLRLTGDRSRMPCKTRHNIARAENQGIEVTESDDFAVFHPILRENKLKFGCEPTHTLAELERIRDLRPDLLKLFLALKDGRPIAGLMLFLVSPVCALNFYTAQDYGYHRYNPVSLLLEHSMRWCAGRGYRYYDYGVSMDTSSPNPLEVSRSLVKFKESMGLTGCIRKGLHRVF